jgi:hypothetical protein
VIEVASELIQGQLEKVLASEPLAKADTQRKLLSYLVERARRGESPKETEIALDVFGKDPSFNGAEHSIVRVSVRSLRQKLAEYYAGPGRDDVLHFDVPKGGYRLAVTERQPPPTPPPETVAPSPAPSLIATVPLPPTPPLSKPRSRWFGVAATAVLVLLSASVLLNIYQWQTSGIVAAEPELARVRDSALWSDIAKSNRPVTVILGDLFMFTQVDEKTGHTLTVRDASINSDEELRAFLANEPSASARGQRNTTMIQKGVAVSMAEVLHIINRPGRRVEVVARDDVPVDDILDHDIIYLGPMVRLGSLSRHYEYRSRYRYISEGPKIVDISTGKPYVPEGSLAAQHRDYALAAKFVGPTGNQIMIITAGARNGGLLQIVRMLTSTAGLKAIQQQLGEKSPHEVDSFEALLSVTGFRQTNLAADVVAVSPLSTPKR